MQKRNLTKRLSAIGISFAVMVGSFANLTFSAKAAGGNLDTPVQSLEQQAEDYAKNAATSLLAIDKDEPENYDENDKSNPYGLGDTQILNINPMSELYKLNSYNLNKSEGYLTNMIYDKYRLNNNTMISDLLKFTFFKDVDSYLKNALWVKSVALDADGRGRKDHIAYVFWDTSKNMVRAIVYDKTNNTIDFDFLKSNGGIAGLNKDNVDYYAGMNFFDITAGDYNGDGLEDFAVYNGAILDVFTERVNGTFYYDNNVDSSKDECTVGRNKRVLNPYYAAAGLNSLTIADNGKNLLFARLASGDINGDGIDDLAVLSYCDKTTDWNSNKYSVNAYVPYLAVCLGGKDKTKIVKNGPDSTTSVCESSASENGVTFDTVISSDIAIGDVAGDGYNSIIVAGKSVTLKDVKDSTADGLLDGMVTTKTLGMAKYSWSGDKISGMLLNGSTTGLACDEITNNGIHTTDDDIWVPVQIKTVATRG